MKVAVFGAGTMGSGIAQVFAAKGHTALMYASSVASAQKHKDKLAASLAKRVAKGKMTQEAVDALLANVLVEEKSAAPTAKAAEPVKAEKPVVKKAKAEPAAPAAEVKATPAVETKTETAVPATKAAPAAAKPKAKRAPCKKTVKK